MIIEAKKTVKINYDTIITTQWWQDGVTNSLSTALYSSHYPSWLCGQHLPPSD